MRREIAAVSIALSGILIACGAAAALELPETTISYRIEVSLDPATRLLDGRETIRWTNPSPGPIDSVPLHLYLNAFAHEGTTWLQHQSLGRDAVAETIRLYDDPWGWTEPTSIRQDDVQLAWRPISPDDGNSFDRSLIEVELAQPVAPGETLTLEIEWSARLPVPMARTGGYEDFFFVAQWFPKIAAFYPEGSTERPAGGFNRHQFHAPTEFVADFADYDVRIGVPDGWTVLATGRGRNEGADGDLVWHRYAQRAVHDFAWVTGNDLVDETATHRLPGGSEVEVRLALPRGTEQALPRWRAATEASLDVMGTRLPPYPYETLTVVMPPWRARATSGMEYPTLIAGSMVDPILVDGPLKGVRMNEGTIAHEFAHQYFYGLVATNEFEDAFLDEGFTQFWGDEIARDTYGDAGGNGQLLGHPIGVTATNRAGQPSGGTEVPSIRFGPSYLIRGTGLATQFYTRPALSLLTAQRMFGRESLDRVFHAYVERWAFRHPRFEDFMQVAREVGGAEMADYLQEAFTRRRIPDYRIVSVDTERFSRPRGRMVTPEGIVADHGRPTETEDEPDLPLAGLDPGAFEDDGTITMEVLDPGYVRERRIRGGVTRIASTPETVDAADDWEEEEGTYHESRTRIRGPGWDHLPLDVVFRFADGAVVRDRWDGRAPYREYRFVRPAPLTRVTLDPEDRIALDPDQANNVWQAEVDRDTARRWSVWFGAVFSTLAEGLGQWL